MNHTTRFGLPFPNLVDETVTPKVTAADILFSKLALNNHLCGDTGMVGARLPQRIAPGHPMIANEQILQSECQRMSHMQIAGHIWRRHHDRIGRFLRLRVTGKMPAGHPLIVPVRLNGVWVIGFWQNRIGHGSYRLVGLVEIKYSVYVRLCAHPCNAS